MKSGRRWFQYSLRSFLVLLTLVAVWLGIIAHRAHEQREAVKAIEAVGVVVIYDWQIELLSSTKPSAPQPAPHGPAWLRRLIGDDYFQHAQLASFSGPDSGQPSPREADILKSIPHLKRLYGLNEIVVSDKTSAATLDQLKAAFPNRKISLF
jgi:hypothetical protein